MKYRRNGRNGADSRGAGNGGFFRIKDRCGEYPAQIMQYGAGTQKKMADFSDEALKNVKSQDLGEVEIS